MDSTQQCDCDTYRVIVFGQGGNDLLVVPAGDGFLLPTVEIPRWQRLAENMTAAIRREWDQNAICLFNPDVRTPVASIHDHKYQVMECLEREKSHPLAEWVHLSSLSQHSLVDPADQVAVQRSLTECDLPAGATEPGPFARLGWFRDLKAWIEAVIEPMGFHLTGSFTQLNAHPSFSLVRFETSGPAVWFKAVGNPNLREFPVTVAVAKLVPRYVPPILATRPAGHGWLALEAKGTNLDEAHDVRQWTAAASAFASLQIESTAGSGILINAGARDLRAPALFKLVHPFLDAIGQVMVRQTKVPPTLLSRNELRLLGKLIEEALSSTAVLGIPDALGHLDLNPGNVIVSEDQCVFLDWAEAYVGNPFFSFQYLLEHSRHVAGFDGTTESGLTSTYARQWQSWVSPESLEEAFAAIPMLAVFAYAVANDAWRDQTRLQDPKVAGYLRGLTRRMHREANRLRNRSALCPN